MALIRICVDTETYTIDKHDKKIAVVKPYLIGISYENVDEKSILDCKEARLKEKEDRTGQQWLRNPNKGENHFKTKNFETFFSVREFVDKLIELSNRNKNTLELVFFNAIYDLLVIYPELLKCDRLTNINSEFKLSDKKQFVSCNFRCKQFNFRVRDLWLWDKTMSVDKWFKKIKAENKDENMNLDELEKLEIDYDKNYLTYDASRKVFKYLNSKGEHKEISYEVEYAYLKADVVGLWYIFDKIEETKYVTLREVGPLLSSTAYDYIKKTDKATSPGFGKHVYCWYLYTKLGFGFDKTFRCEEEYILAMETKLSSFGGFTGYNTKVMEVNLSEPKIMKIDTNSMYPHAMSQNLPNGQMRRSPPKDSETYCTWYCCKFNYLVWKEKYFFLSQAPLPVWKFVEDHQSKSRVILWKEYYDFIIENCDTDMWIDEVLYQRSSPLLEPLISELYLLKEKKDLPKEDRALFKKLMNSQYGKMVEKHYLDSCEYTGEENGWFKKVTKKDPMTLKCNATGAFIIQHSRLMLLSLVKKQIDGGNVFLYSDTDSIVFVQNNPIEFDIDNKKLGYWKVEGVYNKFRVNGKAKKWLLINDCDKNENPIVDVALSGIKAEVQRILKDKLTTEQWWDMFDPKNNYLIVGGSTQCKRTDRWGQLLLTDKDVEFNTLDDFSVTHKLEITGPRNNRSIEITPCH